MSTTTQALEPCPFCGSKASIRHSHDEDGCYWAHVECDKCRARGAASWASSRTSACPIFYEEVREAWNQRTEQQARAAEPVAWIKFLIGAECKPDGRCYDVLFAATPGLTPLFAHPPAAEPKGPSGWEAFKQTEQYKNLARYAGISCNGFTEDDMRQAFQAGERYGEDRCPAGAPQSGESACENCGDTGQIFGHADNCDDDLCALNGDEHSCAGKLAPCSCSAPAAPDIPPGCEMARGWAVEVTAQGERVLLLSDVGYSGLADIEPWASTIRGCAEHLQAFIGPAGGSPELAPEPESLETSEAAAREPHPCASGCRYALNGEGLAPQCFVGCRKAAKEKIKP